MLTCMFIGRVSSNMTHCHVASRYPNFYDYDSSICRHSIYQSREALLQGSGQEGPESSAVLP